MCDPANARNAHADVQGLVTSGRGRHVRAGRRRWGGSMRQTTERHLPADEVDNHPDKDEDEKRPQPAITAHIPPVARGRAPRGWLRCGTSRDQPCSSPADAVSVELLSQCHVQTRPGHRSQGIRLAPCKAESRGPAQLRTPSSSDCRPGRSTVSGIGPRAGSPTDDALEADLDALRGLPPLRTGMTDPRACSRPGARLASLATGWRH